MACLLIPPVASADDLFSGDPFAELGGTPEPAAPAAASDEPPPQQPPQPQQQPQQQQQVAVVAMALKLPITGTRDTQLEAAVLRRLPELTQDPRRRGMLVLRFDSSADPTGEASDFARSLSVARFLTDRRLAGVKTVAWIPEPLAGHGLLVAAACDEIVVGPAASLGPVVRDAEQVDAPMRAAYRDIAARRKTIPPPLALALLDPAARVVRVTTAEGEAFANEGELAEIRRRVAVLGVDELGPPPLSLSARDVRELGIARLVADGPEEVAEGLGIPRGSLAFDPSLAGGWEAVQIPLSGPIDAASVTRVRTKLAEAIDGGANLVCLRIDSPGGSPEQSLVLATTLARLDAAEVRTVAYVPREALGDAALVATACDELVMHPQAILGGDGAANIDQRRGEAMTAAWREGVAAVKGRSWSLPVALALPGLVVHRATNLPTGLVDYFSEQELASRGDRGEWKLGPQIGIGPIKVSGRAAESLGLTEHLVQNAAGLAAAYGLADSMVIAEPGWVDLLFDALARPGVAWLLLLIGGAGLYIELHTPGLGLGGFVAMVAFIVYFWSQYLNGTSGWLEVMLFLAGLFCMAAEIFVLPGFGVLGLGGGLLVVASLVLASQSFVVPGNDYQIRQLQYSLLGVLGAGVGIGLTAALARRWLPSTPVLRNVLLVPPDDGLPDTDREQLDELLGLEGVTTTRLAPAGKARISGRLQDVTADDGLLEPGVPVRVIEVRGSRVVVRSLEPE